jgi:uncharacterized protein
MHVTDPRLMEAMSNPDFYPHHPEQVELIQTHISYVFIAGSYVYKVKKAVKFDFLDFSTLEKRQHFCEEELRLNRRLAPDTYLGVVEIGDDNRGNLRLVEEVRQDLPPDRGERVIDYAVYMRKLPQERMLEKIIAGADFDPNILDAIADKLAAFHRGAETGGLIDEIGGPATIRRNHEENFAETEQYVDITIPAWQFQFIKQYIFKFIEDNRDLLDRRVKEHRIRDCHGDLHIEHIVVADEITIFDCIEFNERFRYEDVAAEVAFLAMDMDYNGYPAHGDRFVRSYVGFSKDKELIKLLNFYKCYYAYVRGKVDSFQSDEPEVDPRHREEAANVASHYFDLAYAYAVRLENPTLILIAGLMGTGKSVLAAQAAPRLGAEVIRSDVLRKELLGMAPTDRNHVEFGAGIYGDDISGKTYLAAHNRAEVLLKTGHSVIIDASYKKREERIHASDMARRLGVDFLVIECVCRDEIVRERLERRVKDQREASDGRWEIYAAQKKDFDRIDELPGRAYLALDTSLPPEECVRKIIERLRY